MGFGGIKLPGVSQEEAAALVNRAIDLGTNFVDTARCYGDSEEKIGHVMAKRRDEVFLATKVLRRSRAEAAEDIATSLKLLQTDCIDLYQVHDISTRESCEAATGPGGALEAILAARDAGKVRFVGVSGHNTDMLIEAIETGIYDTVQVAYNLANTAAAEKLLPRAKELGVGVINMKPMAGGQLLIPIEQQPDEDAPEYDITAEAALRFVMTNPNVSVVIPGMRAMAEVEENLAIGERFQPLSAEEIERYTEMATLLGEGFCRTCGYCLPCTEEIDIPAVLQTIGYVKRFQGDWDCRHRMVEQYHSFEKTSEDCSDCEECESKCPYKLPVREMLKEAHSTLAG